MKKILIVTSDFPFPPNHGGRYDVWERINRLVNLGHSVDLIATVNEHPRQADFNHVDNVVGTLRVLKRSKLHGALSYLPYQLGSRNLLKCVELMKEYQIVLLEGDYVFPVLNNPTLKADEVILRVHNDECRYFHELASCEKRIPKKVYYYFESIRFLLVKKMYFQRVSRFLFISQKEFDNSSFPEISYWLPPTISEDKYKPFIKGSNVVFIGSLFMPNNIEGLNWYLENVHPLLLSNNSYKFVIAGNCLGADENWLNSIRNGLFDSVELIESPPSLNDVYKDAAVFINPMLSGAGLKLKTIDAIANGVPVVSTSVGADGTGLIVGEHIFVSDTAKGFSGCISNVLNKDIGEKMVNNGQAYLRREYTDNAFWNTLDKGEG